MSEDEKAQQIGKVVTEYQAAKVALAHLEQKVKSVGETYAEVGEAIVPRGGGSSLGFKIEKNHLRLVYSRTGNELVTNLLNEESLVSLIVEREEARNKCSALRTQLNSLGITNLQ